MEHGGPERVPFGVKSKLWKREALRGSSSLLPKQVGCETCHLDEGLVIIGSHIQKLTETLLVF